jgi:hypothetical protein
MLPLQSVLSVVLRDGLFQAFAFAVLVVRWLIVNGFPLGVFLSMQSLQTRSQPMRGPRK